MKSNLYVYVAGIALSACIINGSVSQEVTRNVKPDTVLENELTIPDSDDGLPGAGPIRRYDWFQKLWVTKRSKWATEVQEKQGALVFLGDSITQGWGDDFHGAFGDTLVANRGISGDTTRGMLFRLKEDVLALNPTGIVMLLGTNDLEEGAEPETIANNLGLILHQIHEFNPKLHVVLCLVFPASESKKRPVEKIKEINRLYQTKVNDDSKVIVLDTWSLFANELGDAKLEEFPDLLHPNKEGYAKWENALRPLLEVLGLVSPTVESTRVEDGFDQLFNGKDLTGWGFRQTTDEERKGRDRWRNIDPNAPEWPIVEEPKSFDQKTASDDGRFLAANKHLVVSIPPSGRRIQQLWTTKDFNSDFTLKLEFRASPNADSGIFIRGKQLQCRDYSLAGPYKQLKNYKPQQWNEIVIKLSGDKAYCECNGELLEEALVVPQSGPIGLEGDRGQVEYRNIRLRMDN